MREYSFKLPCGQYLDKDTFKSGYFKIDVEEKGFDFLFKQLLLDFVFQAIFQ